MESLFFVVLLSIWLRGGHAVDGADRSPHQVAGPACASHRRAGGELWWRRGSTIHGYVGAASSLPIWWENYGRCRRPTVRSDRSPWKHFARAALKSLTPPWSLSRTRCGSTC